jgi:transposase
MQLVYSQCAGLDVHKRSLTACCMCTSPGGKVTKETRTFSTMTHGILALREWLHAQGCTHVAMESTGVFWYPIYNLLEEEFTIWLVNPQHIKHVPGRKTDLLDAEWIAQLMAHGLLRASFIPPREQRELRELLRHRQGLVEERNRITNRLQKVLEDTNIKLSSIVTDIQGVSAQDILHALLAGETDPHTLAQLARGQLRKRREELAQALAGHLRPHHQFLLTRLLTHLDYLGEEIALVEDHVHEVLRSLPQFVEAVRRLCTIPGIKEQTALVILSEIGVEMHRFPTAKHLTAWAGLAPGNKQSAGKNRPAPTRKGNRYLRRCLVQAARAAAHTKGTYFQTCYQRLAARRGTGRAAIAVARTLLEIVYYLLSRGEDYRELGAEYVDQQDRERTAKRLVHRLEHLGYSVTMAESELAQTG